MFVIAYVTFTVAILGFVLAPLVLSFNFWSRLNRLFFFAMLTIALWAICMAILFQLPHSSSFIDPLIKAVLVLSALANPLLVLFILRVARSAFGSSVIVQALLWLGWGLVCVIDVAGGSFISGIVPTARGNAFDLVVGPSYYLRLSLYALQFTLYYTAVHRAFSRSVSKTYRRNLRIVLILNPIVIGCMIAVDYILPLLLAEPFPSAGVIAWVIVEIGVFVSFMRSSLFESDVSIIMKGVQYSRSSPMLYFNPAYQITDMNDEARNLLSEHGFRKMPETLRDLTRNVNFYHRLIQELLANQHQSISIALADGLSSITLLPETDQPETFDSTESVSDTNKEPDSHISSICQIYDLSPREQDVLVLLLQGLSTRLIGEQLFISHSTAKTHIAKIHQKVGTSSRPALLAKVLLGPSSEEDQL